MKSTKRKLVALMGAALATMAFGASSASAATTVKDAATGEACSAVSPPVETAKSWDKLLLATTNSYSSGGCTVKIASVGTHAVGYTTAPTLNRCYSTIEAHIGPDGWGYADISYLECDAATSSCAGERIVAPAEYNPDPAKTGKGIFQYANASTDLQIALCGERSGGAKLWGFSSYDVGAAGESQGWVHQQSASPHGIWYYITGPYWQNYSGAGVTISH